MKWHLNSRLCTLNSGQNMLIRIISTTEPIVVVSSLLKPDFAISPPNKSGHFYSCCKCHCQFWRESGQGFNPFSLSLFLFQVRDDDAEVLLLFFFVLQQRKLRSKVALTRFFLSFTSLVYTMDHYGAFLWGDHFTIVSFQPVLSSYRL